MTDLIRFKGIFFILVFYKLTKSLKYDIICKLKEGEI